MDFDLTTMKIENIARNYGKRTAQLTKDFIRNNQNLIKAKNRFNYLLENKQRGCAPKFIVDKAKIFNSLLIQDQNRNFSNKIAKLKREFMQKYLKMEIDICRQRNMKLKRERTLLTVRLKRSLPSNIYTQLMSTQKRKQKTQNVKHKGDLRTKLERDKRLNNIPKTFPNPEWCVNLSKKQIPTEAQNLLSLGPKFALTTARGNEEDIIRIMADADEILSTCKNHSEEKISKARNDITNMMIRNIKQPKRLNTQQKEILRAYNKTKEYLKENQDILIINSDKGNKTVIIDKEEYKQKMVEHLADTNTYEPISERGKNLMQTLKRDVNKLIDEIYTKKYINTEEKERLACKDDTPIPPRIYGTIKLHKENNPIRPVVTTINTPTYNLAKYLNTILNSAKDQNTFNIRNSYDFKNKIKSVRLDENDTVLSLDVTSLYTNVPQSEAIKSVLNRWPQIKQHTRIPKKYIIEALKLCICKSNFFMYEDTFYKQNVGMAMGCSLSGTLAEFRLDDLLNTTLEKLTYKPKFIYKYVDDIITTCPKSEINDLLGIFNQQHDQLKFTMELENSNREIPFLDMKLKVESGTITTDWYMKEMASGRILNYNSAHPRNMIFNTALTFAHRVIKLSDKKYHKNNYIKIEQTLKNNSFPTDTIRNIINKVSFHKHQFRKTENKPSYRSLTYISRISETISRTVGELNTDIKIGHKPINKLGDIIFSNTKSKLLKNQQKGVIYKLHCNSQNCKKIYIGETGRELHVRMKEHQKDYELAVKRKGKQEQQHPKTACVAHAINENHKFDFERPKILCRETQWRKRKNIEAYHIQLHGDKTTNFKVDTQHIHKAYKNIIETLRYRGHKAGGRKGNK